MDNTIECCIKQITMNQAEANWITLQGHFMRGFLETTEWKLTKEPIIFLKKMCSGVFGICVYAQALIVRQRQHQICGFENETRSNHV